MGRGNLYQVAVDWNNDGDFGDANEIITADVVSIDYQRGRDYPSQLTGRSIAGQLSVRLNNDDERYSPSNTASVLAGSIVPGRKVQVQYLGGGEFPYTFPFVFGGTTEAWTGFLDDIKPVPVVGGPKQAILTGIGLLGDLNEKRIRVPLTKDILAGSAVNLILDDAGWPAADRNIDAGNQTITHFFMDEKRTRTALREVEFAESGFCAEDKDGKLRFEKRRHRFESNHLDSQATFKDASGGTVTIKRIVQEDPLRNLFNIFECRVRKYSTGATAVLWTSPDGSVDSDAPLLVAGEARSFWAQYPHTDLGVHASEIAGQVAVDSWVTPVGTTDYLFHSAVDGTGTDLTNDIALSVSKFSNALKMTFTNNGTVDAYKTFHQARGQPLLVSDPVIIRNEDETSKSDYGERTFPDRNEFCPDVDHGEDWTNFNLGVYKDPVDIITLSYDAARSAEAFDQAIIRDISDRITVDCQGDSGLQVPAQDYFIEAEIHRIRQNGVIHEVTYQLSPAAAFGGFWVMNRGSLTVSTRLAY